MPSVEIRKVTNKQELDAFIQLHYDLYRGNAYDAPNLYSDEIHTLSKDKNIVKMCIDDKKMTIFLNMFLSWRIASILAIHPRFHGPGGVHVPAPECRPDNAHPKNAGHAFPEGPLHRTEDDAIPQPSGKTVPPASFPG